MHFKPLQCDFREFYVEVYPTSVLRGKGDCGSSCRVEMGCLLKRYPVERSNIAQRKTKSTWLCDARSRWGCGAASLTCSPVYRCAPPPPARGKPGEASLVLWGAVVMLQRARSAVPSRVHAAKNNCLFLLFPARLLGSIYFSSPSL
jgi:hypothetical protein